MFRPKFRLVTSRSAWSRSTLRSPLHGDPAAWYRHQLHRPPLYLTITPEGGFRVIPVNCETDNEYTRTKEIGLLDGVKQWVRLYTDKANKRYRVFPAPVGRFDEPTWPQLSEAKIFRLCFRDKGRLLDSTEHELFKKWAARDR